MNSTNISEQYYSQFGEDKILDGIFNGKKDGFCIEVGANDGINDSNTMYFEKKGWNCVLVEPNPALCKLIRASRRSALFEFAASDRDGEVTLFVAEGAERAHGVSTINAGENELSRIKSYGFTYKEVKVKAKPLDEILGGLQQIGEIDFISVDVEGHELDVLKGFTLSRWNPTVILIEDNSNFEDVKISEYLKKFGYIRFMRTGVNDWYAHEKHTQLVNLVSKSQYNWTAFKGRVKNRIKKIPGVVPLRKYLLNRP